MEANICRICLNLVKNEYELIDVVTRQMLGALSLKIDLDASRNPILCQDCAEITKKAYFFKLAYRDTEQLILSFSTEKERAKFDMKDVYEDSKGVKSMVDFICRFCMNQTERSKFVSLDALMNDVVYIEMVSLLAPEMVLDIIKDSVICSSCKENLECYFKFTRTCLDTEEKINKYRQNEANFGTRQIKLSNLLSFLYTNEAPQISVVKQEGLFEDVEQNTGYQTHERQIKCEEALEIKDEDVGFGKSLPEVTKYENVNHVEIHQEYNLVYETKHRDILKKSASKVETYKCTMCTFETKYKGYQRRHMLVHKDSSEIEMYKCETCTYETKNKKLLTRHMVLHKDSSEVEMHKCQLCTYETRYKDDLRKHLPVHKSVSQEEMHKCEICTYETKSKTYLKRHMLSHKDASEIEMYNCGICGYETRYKDNLKNHMLIHKDSSEIVMYKCGLCTYETKYKYYLGKHMLVHKDCSQVEMYKCELCTYETKYKNALKCHMLKHKDVTEIEMNKCGICAYETRYKHRLKSHLLKHTKKKKINRSKKIDSKTT